MYSTGLKLVYITEGLFVNSHNKNWENLTTEIIDKNIVKEIYHNLGSPVL